MHKLRAFLPKLKAAPKRARYRLGLIYQTLQLIWSASARWTTIWLILLILMGLLPALLVSQTRVLTDKLFLLLSTGNPSVEALMPTLWSAGILVGLMLAQLVMQTGFGWVRTVQAESIQDRLRELVYERAITVDVAFYESAEYHDRLQQASKELTSRPLALLENLGDFLQNGIAVISLAALLIPYGVWLPLLLAGAALPSLLAASRNNAEYYRWWTASTTDRRWLQYYETMITSDAMAPELRMFNLGPHFMQTLWRLRIRLRNEYLQLMQRQSITQLMTGLSAMLAAGAALFWMLWQAFLGLVSLGDIVLFYQSMSRGQSFLQGFMSSVSQIQRHTLYLQNLMDFLEIRPNVVDPPHPVDIPATVAGEIRFRNVTFRYPGTAHYIFQDFSLTLPAHKITALVGFNGAGKTTLLKLLCRFYDPESGTIEIDGIDIKAMRLADLRGLLTYMFQFPVPYLAAVSDNILFGDVTDLDNRARMVEAAQAAGAHDFITKLPHQYATPLGKNFPNGVQLSGGEWQRLALARAFFRQAQIMVLDEPTSLMDLWSEVDWFDRFRELAANRTALLVTHRFLTAMRADLIYVIDQGVIVESGTHHELLVHNGLYAQAWHDQMKTAGAADPATRADPVPA
jgi:ATP-binding cassette subfamily B protein